LLSICIYQYYFDSFYRHPALGGGFGPGFKIEFGFDLVGDYYNGYNLPVPDPDPMDCGGHGTHVTGIIGAEGPVFTGVAPNATLGMYRVFGCSGSTANDVLIAAFIAAQESGGKYLHIFSYFRAYSFFTLAQIITASLGRVSGWTNDPLAVVVSRIAKTGVSCTVAAGNSGAEGKKTLIF
jgi:subtilisin family serine protease